MKQAVTVFVLLGAACGAPREPRGAISVDSASGALHAVLVTTPDPVERGTNGAELTLTGPQGEPLVEQSLTVTPWMPAHGHGSGVEPTVTELGEGRYALQSLNFPMAGLWQLRIATASDELAPTVDVP